MRRIALLGSTGSIGTQTLDVVRRLPDKLRVVAIGAGSNVEMLTQQAKEFGVQAVALFDESRRRELRSFLPKTTDCCFGADGLEDISVRSDVDVVVVAVAGSIGMKATIAALKAGKAVALATKEVLVAAGQIVCDAAEQGGGKILPIDSEHSGLFQCLQGQRTEDVAKLWLTASGGPFRTLTASELETVTAADALKHPTWNMGPKITIDSATMMNKGLETIEACWLFNTPVDQVDVVVHPQSVVHSMVEMRDGSFLAQMGLPDMRVPIEYALLYPERADMQIDRLNPQTMGTLTFEPPDSRRFPCLELAREAIKIGGTMPAVLNAANEVAVKLFLQGRTTFSGIPRTIRLAMTSHGDNLVPMPSLEDVYQADKWARQFVAAMSPLQFGANA